MILLYLVTAVLFLAIDAVVLTLFMGPLFRENLGPIMRESPMLGAAAGFYLAYVAGSSATPRSAPMLSWADKIAGHDEARVPARAITKRVFITNPPMVAPTAILEKSSGCRIWVNSRRNRDRSFQKSCKSCELRVADATNAEIGAGSALWNQGLSDQCAMLEINLWKSVPRMAKGAYWARFASKEPAP